jgi:hypothetical protein
MDTVAHYRQLVQQLLRQYAAIPYPYGDIENLTVFDEVADHYLLLEIGWQGRQRVHGCVIHIDLIDGKVWIQHNNTDQHIAEELLQLGVPRDCIVLAFHPPELRPHTEYAPA